MASISNYLRISLLAATLVCVSHACATKFFNVEDYGAIADDKVDSTYAFLRAWDDACRWRGRKSVVKVPKGTFRIGETKFSGECKPSKVIFRIDGILKPSNLRKGAENWIKFKDIKGLTVKGNGVLNAEGRNLWTKGDRTPNHLPETMKFEYVTDSRISGLTSQDSQHVHFHLYKCKDVVVENIKVSAPGDSHNTDGIKISHSKNIRVLYTRIETGDDCISILKSSEDIEISNVHCGPGHGISIGSLGEEGDREANIVRGVSVKKCWLKDTLYGLRIKSFGTSVSGLVSDLTYEDIEMDNVRYPIIIDQDYCPDGNCKSQVSSNIQIKDVRYNNIGGTSSSKVAVSLNCSGTYPCMNIVMNNIKLSGKEFDGLTRSTCVNAHGVSFGGQMPPPCF